MWSNNTGDTEIEGDQIEIFMILNGHENIDTLMSFSKLRRVKELYMTSR